MKVPKRIKVGRKYYAVRSVATVNYMAHGARGCIDPWDQLIEIAKRHRITGQAFSDEVWYNTFWHETVHAILHDMGHEALFKNEAFVQGMADRLCGVFKSAEF